MTNRALPCGFGVLDDTSELLTLGAKAAVWAEPGRENKHIFESFESRLSFRDYGVSKDWSYKNAPILMQDFLRVTISFSFECRMDALYSCKYSQGLFDIRYTKR